MNLETTTVEFTVKNNPRYESETILSFIEGQEEFFVPKSELQEARLAARIASLRNNLGMNQSDFAAALKVGQSNVSKWELGHARPLPDLLIRMAGLAEGVEKLFFLDAAGIPKEFFFGNVDETLPSDMVSAAVSSVAKAFGSAELKKSEAYLVPILTDPVAAGNPITIDERDIEVVVPIPAVWLPRRAAIYGLRVKGDSMEPILNDNDIALVDVGRTDLKKLDGHMVAARVGDGVTIKWLRKYGRFYQLVPQNTSLRHEIVILGEGDNWSIVGEVIKWIGGPPPPKKR